MPTTRSSAKQLHIDDFACATAKRGKASKTDYVGQASLKSTKPQSSTRASSKKPTISAKRKSGLEKGEEYSDPPAKQAKKTTTRSHTMRQEPAREKPSGSKSDNASHQAHFTAGDITKLDHHIIINRAPVLQLWGAVVARYLYSDLTWPACLSVGNAISSLCAVSKGRSIGVIEPPDEEKQGDRKQESASELRSVHVMGFNLHVKKDAVILGGKPKVLREDTLKRKFGDEEYKTLMNAFTEALESWKDQEADLNKRAFHMYERFRPNVASGQKGWGRKGELNVQEVVSVVRK